jgi:glyoxylate reductase
LESTNNPNSFDEEVVNALSAAGVKWIAHNGAGYDQIDVAACIKRGESALPFMSMFPLN